METLADGFWIGYYIFLGLTLISGIVNWVKQIYSPFAAAAIILSLFTPLAGFLYFIGRPEGMNEYGYLTTQFQAGDGWAIFLAASHIYFIIWWILFLNIWGLIRKIPAGKDKLMKRLKKAS